MFVNKDVTLFICENCTAIGSGDNAQYSLSIRPSYGARGEGGGGEEKGRKGGRLQ